MKETTHILSEKDNRIKFIEENLTKRNSELQDLSNLVERIRSQLR